MANRRASISAGLRADASGWKKGLDQARADTARFKNDVEKTKINGPGFMGMSKGFVGLAASAGAAAVAVRTLFKSDVKYDKMLRALSLMSDGTETITEQYNALVELGNKPGIGFDEALKGSIALQSVGFRAKEARDIMEQFSNALASVGGGKDDLDAITISLQQMAKTIVDAGNLKEISRRLPAVADLAGGINKDDPIKFIRDLTAELAKQERVTAGVAEAQDNAADAAKRMAQGFTKGKAGGIIGGAFSAASDVMSGNLSKAFTDAKASAEDIMANGFKSALEKYELSETELAKRREEFVKKAGDEEIRRREMINQTLREQSDIDESISEMLIARASGNERLARHLEDEIEGAKEIRDLKKDGARLDADQLAAVKALVVARRADKDAIQAAANAKKMSEFGKESKLASLRHMGRNRQADRLEDKNKVDELVAGGLDRKSAEFMVDKQRDMAEDEALGPGRRRIRGAKKAPAIPQRTERDPVKIPGGKKEEVSADAASSNGIAAPIVAEIKGLRQDLRQKPNEAQRAANR